MDAQKVLTAIGLAGFLSVFQAAGVGILRGVLGAAREEQRVAGVAGGVLFAGLFALAPLAMAFEHGGGPGLAVQAAVLAALVWMVHAPHLPPAPETPAGDDGDGAPRASRWARAAAAVPPLAAAAGYAAALWGRPLPAMPADGLAHVVRIEFLVIHSFPFLSLITLPRLRHRRWRCFQWFLFLTWFCLYLAFAVEGEHGWSGVLAFVAATAATYLGFLLRRSGKRRIRLLVKRWGASLALFLLCAVATGSGGFEVERTTLWHGLVYFLLLAAAEAAGLYDLRWGRRRTGAPAAEPAPEREPAGVA